MRNDRQTRALAQLLQLKQLQALAERRQALAAAARVEAVGRQIGAIAERIAAEAAAHAGPAEVPALARWTDLMEGRRLTLLARKAGEQHQADALAARATAADTIAEQHRELLALRHRKLSEDQRRTRERAEWEALASLVAVSPHL